MNPSTGTAGIPAGFVKKAGKDAGGPSLVIGSRGSQLALTQSRHIADQLRALAPGASVSIEIISTTGDRILDAPLARIGGKGLFTKELETALLEDRIDLAVHSLKDLPTELPDGLCVGAIPSREDPSDALVCGKWPNLDAIPDGAAIGTSSLRRKAQLLAFRSTWRVVDLRGNIDTRIRKVAEGRLDAAVLAGAGLNRIGRGDVIAQLLPPDIMISAPGQGALGIEMRTGDQERFALVSRLTDPNTTAEVTAERALLSALGGGCQVPIGALGRVQADTLTLKACVCSLDGAQVLRITMTGPRAHPEELGRRAADALLARGAGALMDAVR